jgi:hypothetical protein
MFQIHWDNAHACGIFPETYENYGDAEASAKDWLLSMIMVDEDPADARQEYSYTIVEVSSR